MINLGLPKNLITYLIIALIKLLSSAFQALGVLWFVIQIANYFFSDLEFVKKIPDYWEFFLLFGIIVGLYKLCTQFKINKRIGGKDVDIEIKIGDIFRSNQAIVIGCNTTFDISLTEQPPPIRWGVQSLSIGN